MPESSYADLLRMYLDHRAKRIEVRKPKSGLRHNKETVYIPHRFDVKDGITNSEMLMRIIGAANPLLKHLRNR